MPVPYVLAHMTCFLDHCTSERSDVQWSGEAGYVFQQFALALQGLLVTAASAESLRLTRWHMSMI
jgi:hypothetical protein